MEMDLGQFSSKISLITLVGCVLSLRKFIQVHIKSWPFLVFYTPFSHIGSTF